ncbi:hypothetical protein B0H15DRAFT_464811 [Mycena belliarum]|uniref:Uncharacterized protein n=1 Tax=Mycena belliarum TaxID=1033014 RepID=A0AAD6XSY6_9AGAR|nr:hypothetical protein B0H15DRAFT_464811 [Mycena belliae]
MALAHPAFPQDLERHIFEIAALCRPRSISTLVLVAWRVKEWVEPLLYRTVVVGDVAFCFWESYPDGLKPDPWRALINRRTPAARLASVRNLQIDGTDLVGDEHLDNWPGTVALCPGLQNLWLSKVPFGSDVYALKNLLLRRLHCEDDGIFASFSPTHRFFSQLTHLEISHIKEPPILGIWLDRLSLLPQLSHFSFTGTGLLHICKHLLQACSLLSVLVHLHNWRPYPSALWDYFQDTRFVNLKIDSGEEWMRGIHTGMDYWKRAEILIEQRRSGEIEVSQYWCD